MVKLIREMFEYNFHSNSLLFDNLKVNNIYNAKIIELMSHVLNSTSIWMNRINAKSVPAEPWAVYDLDSLILMNKDIEKEFTLMLKNISDDMLSMQVTYRNSLGAVFSNTLLEILFHLSNHATHHRGQVVMLMRQDGYEPPKVDYIFYKRD